MRLLTDHERRVVLAMANEVGSDTERAQLLSDLDHCVVEDVLSDGTRLMFHIDGYQRPPYRGQDTFRGKDRFPVEGILRDADGADMEVALYSDQNDRVLEFELVKQSADPVCGPDWHSFKLK